MIRTVAVVGAAGRVGAALARHLSARYDVVPITRQALPGVAALAERAAEADVIVNAAGVAHVETATPADLERLERGNVELPLALAGAALARRVSLVHVSSVKALSPGETPYAASKHRGEAELRERFAQPFDAAGLSLVLVRPLAMLFPPFDAGRLATLKPLRFVPRALVPPMRLPALTSATFLGSIDSAITSIADGSASSGLSTVDFGRSDHATLREIRDAIAGAADQR